jgi:hypothetical protein
LEPMILGLIEHRSVAVETGEVSCTFVPI